MTRLPVYVLSAWMALLPLRGAEALVDKKALTLETAKSMAEAAEKTAVSHQWSMVIVVMDDGGNLLLLHRMNDAPLGSVQVAQEKAHTAVIFKGPSKNFEDGLAKGNMSLLKLNVLPFEGGIPIVVGGKVIGAIGVSGGSAAQDGQVAKAGADWLVANLK